MSLTQVFRTDATNVGDWYCSPMRYFQLGAASTIDILDFDPECQMSHVVLGGGGLIAKTFHGHMQRLADTRPSLKSLVAWGIGESENVDRKGGFVNPFEGIFPDYLKAFDLVGVRDFGTEYRWVPCASCMLPQLDQAYAVQHEVVIYEHKRIAIPLNGKPRLSNDGNNIDAVLAFLASGETVITNSYHGAYWATLLGKRVIAIPNMSKMYRLKHFPIVCRADEWKRFSALTRVYPEALAECRAANLAFFEDVKALHDKTRA